MEKLLGVYWDQPEPMLHTSEHDAPGIPLMTGDELTIRLTGARHCIGTYDTEEDARVGCPTDTVIEAGPVSHCPQCQGESFTARTGLEHADASSLLDAEHTVYLALFGQESIKVGVTRTVREQARLREQGAAASLFIATGDGRTVRQLEQRIHEAASIPTQVRTTRKLELLASPPTVSAARLRLHDTLAAVRQQMGDATHLEENFNYWQDAYGINESSLPPQVELVTAVDAHAELRGTVAGVLGQYILLQNNETLYALGSSLLEGYDAEVTAAHTPARRDVAATTGITTRTIPIDMQGSLF